MINFELVELFAANCAFTVLQNQKRKPLQSICDAVHSAASHRMRFACARDEQNCDFGNEVSTTMRFCVMRGKRMRCTDMR